MTMANDNSEQITISRAELEGLIKEAVGAVEASRAQTPSVEALLASTGALEAAEAMALQTEHRACLHSGNLSRAQAITDRLMLSRRAR